MERLTIRNSDGSVSQPTSTTFATAMYRLAAYEDTRMEPERVAELTQAERDGRLVVLPIGITVDDLHSRLRELDEPQGDAAETYTTGYRAGHKNGQIELLRWLLGISDGTTEEAAVERMNGEGEHG